MWKHGGDWQLRDGYGESRISAKLIKFFLTGALRLVICSVHVPHSHRSLEIEKFV